jgi:hypothetical protein
MTTKTIFAGVLLLAFIVTSCSVRERPRLPSNNEPPVIILRNSSDQYLQSITLVFNQGEKGGQEIKGTISPVPQGVSQIYTRPTKQLRIPESIVAVWETQSGKIFNQTVRLDKILNEATGQSNESLVFDVISETKITGYLEYN